MYMFHTVIMIAVAALGIRWRQNWPSLWGRPDPVAAHQSLSLLQGLQKLLPAALQSAGGPSYWAQHCCWPSPLRLPAFGCQCQSLGHLQNVLLLSRPFSQHFLGIHEDSAAVSCPSCLCVGLPEHGRLFCAGCLLGEGDAGDTSTAACGPGLPSGSALASCSAEAGSVMFCDGALCLEDSCADATSTCIASTFITVLMASDKAGFARKQYKQ